MSELNDGFVEKTVWKEEEEKFSDPMAFYLQIKDYQPRSDYCEALIRTLSLFIDNNIDYLVYLNEHPCVKR